MSYQDVMNMPVYERRLYLGHLMEEVDHQNKETEKANSKNSSSSGGNRTRRE